MGNNMKIIMGLIAAALLMMAGACGNENEVISKEDSTVSGAEVICLKMMPPKCSVDGKEIETNPLGTPKKDADGNFILKNQ
jgi:hypothetical protein